MEGLPYDEELIKHGHRLTFSCIGDGLKLEGEREITCQLNGEWSSSFPKCVGKDIWGIFFTEFVVMGVRKILIFIYSWILLVFFMYCY